MEDLDSHGHLVEIGIVSISIVSHDLVMNFLRHVRDLTSHVGSCVDIAESIQVSWIGAGNIFVVGLSQKLGCL